MEEIVYKAEPKHHAVLKVILSILGIVVVGAVFLVVYKGSDVQQAMTDSEVSSGEMKESSGSEELINGIAVPPEPDPTTNNATLAGVDSNNNGVRDDVERILAGASKKSTYEAQTLPIAQIYQQLATSQLTTPEEAVSLINKIYCFEIKRPSSERQTFSAEGIKYITNNTPERVSNANTNEVLVATKPALIEGGFSCQSPDEVTLINGISVPSEPDSTTNNTTLAGVDSNQNGVRDDVERVIAMDYGQSARKHAALMQTASAIQQFITQSNPQIAPETYLGASTTCLAAAFMNAPGDVAGGTTASAASTYVESKILNTSMRIKAYAEANANLGGTVTSSPPFNQAASYCKFSLDALPN